MTREPRASAARCRSRSPRRPWEEILAKHTRRCAPPSDPAHTPSRAPKMVSTLSVCTQLVEMMMIIVNFVPCFSCHRQDAYATKLNKKAATYLTP